MIKIIMSAIFVLSASGFLMQVFAIGGPGAVFDNKSTNNTNLSYTTENHNLDFTKDNTTVGAEQAVENTLGNTTMSSQSDPNPNPPNMTQDAN